MSPGPIVTIGGQEVYYAGRPRPTRESTETSLTRTGSTILPPQGRKSDFLVFTPERAGILALVFSAGLLVLLMAVFARRTRHGPCSGSGNG